MARIRILLALLLWTVSLVPGFAQISPAPGVAVKDEGTLKGRAAVVDCIGSGVVCDVSGGVITITGNGVGTGLAEPAGDGIVVRSGSGNTVNRSIVGTTGNLVCTNGDGVAGNPTCDVGSTIVQTDQANTWTSGLQDFNAVTLKLPIAAGAAPATEGLIQVDSTSHTLEIGLNGVNKTVAMTDSNITGNAASLTDGDKGDITASSGTLTVDADSIALTTDTTGNYAAGDGEAGSALTGDSATSFFSAGQIENARGGTGDDTSGTTGVPRIDSGNWTYSELSGDVTTSGSNVTVVGDDSHAHTTTTISGLDISADTNLAVTAPVVLTNDTVSCPTCVQDDTNETLTGYYDISGGQLRIPETVVGSLPSAASHTGKVFLITDAATAGSCTSGAGTAKSFCRSNGSVWESVGDGGGAGSSVNTFETMNAPAGTDPAADSGVDTLNLVATSPVTITGDSSTDTLTFALAADSISATQVDETGNFDWTGVHVFDSDAVRIDDTDASHQLIITPGSNLTANRVLTITTGDAARTITLSGDTTLSGTNTGDQTITLTGDVTGSGTGSFAATIAANSVALTTDTTGNYAAGDAEAGNALVSLTGDSATSFFSAGQIENARGGTGDDTSATTGVPRIDSGNWTYSELSGDVVTSGSNATTIQANAVALTTDTSGNYVTSVATSSPLSGGAAGSEGAALTLSITANGINATQIDETVDYTFTTLSGKQDRNNSAVSDDDCTGEQGNWWYDTTDGAFEFCDANSGTPTVLAGGGDVTAVGDCPSGPCFTGASGTTLQSNTDLILELDNNNDGSNSFILRDGADATVFSVSETGQVTTGASATPTIAFKDSDATDGDDNGTIGLNCVDVSSGSEDCTVTMQQQVAGTATTFLSSIAAGAATFGNSATTAITFTTDGTGNGEVVVPNQSISGAEMVNDTVTATQVDETGNFSWSGIHDFDSDAVQIDDTDASHQLIITPGSNLTVDRVLTITTGDAARTLTLSGDATITGSNTGDQTITLTGDVTGSGTGSFATTIAANSVALTTDTTGNYVTSVATSAPLSGGAAGSEGATLTLSVTADGVGPTQIDETANYSFTTLSGKIDRNTSAVSDDDCTGEQGNWWYDTTDNAFEFCDANSGTPTVLAGGGDVTAVGDCPSGACFTGASGTTLQSNTDLILELDNDNNGTESFIVRDGADATVFEVTEAGVTTSVAGYSATRRLSLNGVTGATLGDKITACATALSSGGVCDGSELTGSQTLSGTNTVTQANIRVILPQTVTVSAGGQLALNGEGSTLQGHPACTTVDASAGTSSTSVFVSTASGYHVEGCGTVTGNRAAGGTASIFDVQGASLITGIDISGWTLINAGADAIKVKQISGRIHDNIITTPKNNSIICVTQCDDFQVQNNIITGDASGVAGNSGIGITCTGATPCPTDFEISGNTLTNIGVVAIRVGRASPNFPSRGRIHHNTINGAGINAVDGECITIEGNSIEIDSNIIKSCYGHGIVTFESIKQVSITNNRIGNTSTNAGDNAAAAIGLYLGHSSQGCFVQENVLITGNQIHDEGTATTPYPIYVEDQCTATGGTIANAQIWNNPADNALNASDCRDAADCDNPEADFLPRFPGPIVLETNGVILDSDGDGAFSITGNSTGSDENLTINLDDTSNVAEFTSTSSVATIDMDAFQVLVGSEAYDSTGWNGDTAAPQKDAVRDKIEAMSTPVKPLWVPVDVTDGTQCAAPAMVTINSGPKIWTTICADNDGSTIEGSIKMPVAWNGGTVTFTHVYIQTAGDTGALNGDIACQARSNGEAPTSTWGTEVAIDDAAVVGSNSNDMTTSAAVTCSGTGVAGGDMLYFRYQIDAAGTTTSVSTLHHLGFFITYGTSSLSE